MPKVRILEPRKLSSTDDRSKFACGAEELDIWFQRYAKQNLQANNAVTYVTTTNEGQIAGYYAICSAGVSKEHVPDQFGKRRPQDIPCILLARLAIDKRFQGHGIGRHLFRDAITRAISASEAIGAACLLIHARDSNAKQFYMDQIDLLESPVDELHLILPIKSAASALKQQSDDQK